jgi:S1-C subfamily serine protease
MSKILVIILALSAFFSGCAGTSGTPEVMEPAVRFTPVPLTVLVRVTCKDGQGWGSGSIYQGKYVLTANHVTDDDSCDITVNRWGEAEYSAKVLRRNPAGDIALLSINHDYKVGFEVGENYLDQPIVCSGFPIQPTDGQNPYLSVSRGTILTVDVNDGDGILVNRTDAAILFGSSGGGCFSEDGRLIGVADSLVKAYQDYKFLLRAEDVKKFLDTGEPYLPSVRTIRGRTMIGPIL